MIDKKLTTDTVCDASPVSLPYFALNITVLLADGAHEEIITAIRIVPLIPSSLYITYITAGKAISLINPARKIFFLLNFVKLCYNILELEGIIYEVTYSSLSW